MYPQSNFPFHIERASERVEQSKRRSSWLLPVNPAKIKAWYPRNVKKLQPCISPQFSAYIENLLVCERGVRPSSTAGQDMSSTLVLSATLVVKWSPVAVSAEDYLDDCSSERSWK